MRFMDHYNLHYNYSHTASENLIKTDTATQHTE